MFAANLLKHIDSSLANNYEDNYDYIRFGKKGKSKDLLEAKTHELLLKRDFVKWRAQVFSQICAHLDQLEKAYQLLEDEGSKELFVQLVAFRLLGHRKVKLPLSHPNYWKELDEIAAMGDTSNSIDPGFMNFKLHQYDLTEMGFPIHFYYTPKGVYTDFKLKQYEFHKADQHIKVQAEDVVIDAGGCWGDTALYFAHECGEKGKIYTFEFIPSNLKILKKNLALNPELEKRIEVLEHPLWDTAGLPVYYLDKGPGSQVAFERKEGMQDQVDTLTIDELVAQKGLERLDWIKMDIEGAEPYALKGAEESIRKFKPKLAIAIYHSISDFCSIPEWIDQLGLGYKFYLGHYTIHQEESILFAV